MSFQLWTILHLISLIPALFLLQNIIKMRQEEKTESIKYYSLFLVSLTSLPIVNFLEINSPDSATSQIFGRLFFVSGSILIFFFVLSAEYFTKVPKKYEILFFITPLILSIVINFFSPYLSTLEFYGWQGTWVDPVARYSWLTLANIVVI